jgi:hypothetical protein
MLICIVILDAVLYAKFGDDTVKLLTHSILIVLIILAYALVMAMAF